MDANIHAEKSEVLQATKAAGWRDVASGFGDTFRMSYNKKRADHTVEWNKMGEQTIGIHLAKSGSIIQEDHIRTWAIVEHK